ncbi:helix-turn-helix transcriptional regulator [Aeromonas veronii]
MSTSNLITIGTLCEMLAISRPTVWRRRKDDPTFPQPIYIGVRAIRFRVSDTLAYIENLAAKGGAKNEHV